MNVGIWILGDRSSQYCFTLEAQEKVTRTTISFIVLGAAIIGLVLYPLVQ